MSSLRALQRHVDQLREFQAGLEAGLVQRNYLAEQAAGMQAQLVALTRGIDADLAERSRAIGEFLSNALEGSVGREVERMLKAGQALEPYARTVGERGWTIPVDFPPDVVIPLASLTSEELDASFVAYYTESKGAHFESLQHELRRSKALKRWKPLLRQCVSAYRRRHYLAATPGLILIFEGAFAAATVGFQHRFDVKGTASKQRKTASFGIRRVFWVSLESFVHLLYADRRDEPTHLNRNWIMHGKDSPEWDQADCLRLFQALRTLSIAVR